MDLPNRADYERKLARRVGRELRGQVDDIVDLLTETPDFDNVPQSWWTERTAVMQDVIAPVLREVYIAQAVAELEALELEIELDWQIVNRAAAEWARSYTYDLVSGLMDTSRDILRENIGSYFENQWTIGDLVDQLTSEFGPTRAESIAVTEVTRAASAGEEELESELASAGINMNEVWHTNNDELVCDTCGPLDMGIKGIDWTEAPPAHPNCRCFVGLEVRNA